MTKMITDILKPFVYLFDDALGLLWLMKNIQNDNFGRPHTLPRQTILTLATVIEAGANCCLDELHLNSKNLTDLEKLTTLGKYTVYLLSRDNKKVFNRGAMHVQPILELKTIRDNLVHPKVNKQTFKKIKTGYYAAPYKSYPHLKICRDSGLWGCEEAEKVFKCVVNFFDYFFFDECAHSIKEVRDILFSEIALGERMGYCVEWSKNSPDIAKKLSLQSKFLSIVKSF
jgi:hypothetical protein